MPSAAATGSTHDRVAVDVNAATVQELGIRLEVVGRQSLTQEARAVATIVPDESRISHVHTRVAGWVEQLDVNTTGEMVTAGQPLARIFSQELLSSQTEYLAARRNTAASGISSAVIASGRTRLTVLGMAPDEIDAIEQSGEPKRLVTVVAPRSGVVVNRGVTAARRSIRPPRCSRLRTCRASGCSRRCRRRVFRAFASGRSRSSTSLRQGASRSRHVWTSSIRRSPTARARCASASRRPIRAAASDRACMERRSLNRRDRS